MNKLKLAQSNPTLGRSKTSVSAYSYSDSCVRYQENPTMSYEDNTRQYMLVQNVKDLKRRLHETEKTLRTISQAEAKLREEEGEEEDLNEVASLISENFLRQQSQSEELFVAIDQEERESIQSGLATLPESSYAGFERLKPPSSTPNRPQALSRLPHINLANQAEEEEEDLQGNGEQGDLLEEVRFLKEANKKMLIQNHKLLAELEKQSHELQSSRAKMRELSSELNEYRQSVPDLEEKIVGLQAETEVQDKALREAEERYEHCQREVVDASRKIRHCQQEIEDLRAEMMEEKKLRKATETQRDEALQNFLEVQDTLEDFQKKTNDRQRKYEQMEDELRDSLAHANKEREDLLERLAYFQHKVKSQQEEVRRLQALEEMEQENRTDMDEQNMELRSQISKLTGRISQLETETAMLENLRRENTHLRSEVDHQQNQLSQCQQEIEESRTMLIQLEQLARQVQQSQASRGSSRHASFSNDSGNFSLRPGQDGASVSMYKGDSSLSKSPNHSYSHPASGTGSGAKAILTDLRLQLALKDADIQRLQSSLQARESNDKGQSSQTERLQQDLAAMLEKNQKEAERVKELESLLTQLEVEKSRLSAQVSEYKRELSDRDTQNSSVEMRINQRNSQLIELQEQINEKSLEVSSLEREVRKKNSQVTSLEEQLEEKTVQMSQNASQMRQLEKELVAKEEESQKLHRDLFGKQQEMNQMRESMEKIQALHRDHCKDFEKQIEILQERVENKTSQAENSNRQLTSLRQELEEKTERLQNVEQSLQQTEEALKLKSQQSQKALQQLEQQTSQATSQIQQLETSLHMYKEEIKTYIGVLEESKDKFDRELSQKDNKIKRLEKLTKQLSHDLEEKSDENLEYEKALVEHQIMLQQSSSRVSELENTQAELQKQVSILEHKLLKTNANWVSDTQTLDKKLRQACEELELARSQNSQLTESLRELQEEKKKLSTELGLLEGQLKDEQEESENKTDRASKLEKDIRDLRVTLEQKIELVTDLEDQIQSKGEDLKQQMQLINDLDEEMKRHQNLNQEQQNKIKEVQEELNSVLYESKAKDQMLEDMKDSLARTQEELSESNRQVVQLKEALEDRQNELDQRVAQVNQLDLTIKERHTEMEQRVHKLDTNVRKNQAEVIERTKQIADLDDKVHQTQALLREKSLQLQNSEQLAQKQHMELQGKTARLDELQGLVERQKAKLEEQKEENVEITQELRLTREQLQQQHADFMATRRELAQSHRDNERLQRELEETLAMMKSKDNDIARLAEQAGSAKARETQAENKAANEVKRLTQEVEDMEKRYGEELKGLREELADYVEANEVLKAQQKEQKAKFKEVEQHYADNIELATRELEEIQRETATRKNIMDATNEQLILKDSEIARLQAKISGLERTIGALRAAESFSFSRDLGRNGRHSRNSDQGSIVTDVSVTVPGSPKDGQDHQIQIRQQFEFQENNGLGMGDNGQTRFESSGPVRVINFSDNEENNSYQGVCRPKPLMLNSVEVQQSENWSVVRSGTSPESVINSAQHGNQSAFSRVVKVKKSALEQEEYFSGEREEDPDTAVGYYTQRPGETTELFSPRKDKQIDIDPEQCLMEIQERLRSNELRQQEIDRQLESLDMSEDDTSDR